MCRNHDDPQFSTELTEAGLRELRRAGESIVRGHPAHLGRSILIHEIASRLAPKQQQKRLSAIIVLVLVACTLTALLTPLSRTDIVMSFGTSRLAVDVDAGNVLLGDGLVASTLDITGVTGGASGNALLNRDFHRVRLFADKGATGSIRLTGVEMEAANRLRLTRDGNGPESPLSFSIDKPTRVRFALALFGRVRIQIDNELPVEQQFAEPTAVLMATKPGKYAEVAVAPSPESIFLKRESVIHGASFMSQPWTGVTPEASQSLVSSGLAGGKLVFASFKDRTIPIYPGERVSLGGLRGRVDNVKIGTDRSISGVITGSVGSIYSGPEEGPTNLMPSRLEWWSERHELWLLWGAVTSIYLFIVSVAKWFTKSPE